MPIAVTTSTRNRCGYPWDTGSCETKIKPPAAISRPVPTTSFVPKRSASRGEIGATTKSSSACGSRRTPASQRRVAEHVLQVLREQEDGPNSAKNASVIAHVGCGEPAVLEEADVQHRVAAVQLPDDEADEHDDARDERGRHTVAGSSPCTGASMTAQRSDDQARDRQDGADRVEARRIGVAATSGARAARRRAAMPMGTLTRNTEPHA